MAAPEAIWVGTSGYAYPEWRGSFYPEKMPTTKMLPYYAERFPTVEINNTFYRMPNAKLLEGWSAQVPERYKLTLKAPQRITHQKRLRDCADDVKYFLEVAGTLGPKLGAILFQTPPYLRMSLEVLDGFLEMLPAGLCAAFEFRHKSWMEPDVFSRLQARGLALCIADSENFSTPVEITAGYAYFRLRDEGYQPADIERWAQVIRDKTAACSEVFVYFKHEEAGIGTEFARQLIKSLSG
ncbi:MAG TPA: DUF72 domain-containing protein [Steroidobacteraceae bacterium]|nr:DUF72 domain-containing protein [Steroidobacteraceae bacterium]